MNVRSQLLQHAILTLRFPHTTPILRDQKLVGLISLSVGASTEEASNEAPHQTPGFVMRRDHGIASMVRGTMAGNVSVSSPRWNRVAPGSAPVLRSTPGTPHLPPSPPSSPTSNEEGGMYGAGTPPPGTLPLSQAARKGKCGEAGTKACWHTLTS